jgi:hypothetical protein
MSPQAPRRASIDAEEIAGRRAVMARDAGLRRISRVTRRVVLGAIALSGGLAVTAANAFHGHTITTGSPSSSSTQASSPSTQPSSSSTQSTTSSGLSAPAQTPAPTPVQPVVVSGGS